MKVLFSPIGGTDPIRSAHDGAMLHICRHYKPNKVYFYLTAEMSTPEKIARVTYAFDQLQKYMNYPMEYVIISREDLWEVQVFDTFVKEFDKMLDDIRQKDNPDEFFLNVSSGTPAMKSSLLLLSVLSSNYYKPIQVSTPARRLNRTQMAEELNLSDQALWESNLDNEEGADNRCEAATAENWLISLRKNLIKRHIEKYNYEAALSIAESTEGISSKYRELLNGAVCRLQMNFNDIHNHWDNEMMACLPSWSKQVKAWNERVNSINDYNENTKRTLRIDKEYLQKLFEYAFNVEIKLKKKEYADFVRSLTPLSLEIYLMSFRKYLDFDLYANFGRLKNGSTYEWDLNEVKADPEIDYILSSAYSRGRGFTGGNIGNNNASTLLLGMLGDKHSNLIDRIKTLQKVDSIRNMPAHQLISVTDQWISNRISTRNSVKSSADIIKDIHYLLKELFDEDFDGWNSYDDMNKILIQRLDAEKEDVSPKVLETEKLKELLAEAEADRVEAEKARAEAEAEEQAQRLAAEKAAEEERRSLIEEKEAAIASALEVKERVEKVEAVAIDAIARAEAAEKALKETEKALEAAETQSVANRKRRFRPVHTVVSGTRNMAAGTFKLGYGAAYVSTLIAKDVKDKILKKR